MLGLGLGVESISPNICKRTHLLRASAVWLDILRAKVSLLCWHACLNFYLIFHPACHAQRFFVQLVIACNNTICLAADYPCILGNLFKKPIIPVAGFGLEGFIGLRVHRHLAPSKLCDRGLFAPFGEGIGEPMGDRISLRLL